MLLLDLETAVDGDAESLIDLTVRIKVSLFFLIFYRGRDSGVRVWGGVNGVRQLEKGVFFIGGKIVRGVFGELFGGENGGILMEVKGIGRVFERESGGEIIYRGRRGDNDNFYFKKIKKRGIILLVTVRFKFCRVNSCNMLCIDEDVT